MDSEKSRLARLLITHLSKKPKIKTNCENFSSHYGEDTPRRCLLGEYMKENGEPYFNLEEIRTLCPRFRQEQQGKCEVMGVIPVEPTQGEQELQKLLKEARKEYEKNKKPEDY